MNSYVDRIDMALHTLELIPNQKRVQGIINYLTPILSWEDHVLEKDWPKIVKEYMKLAQASKISKKHLPDL